MKYALQEKLSAIPLQIRFLMVGGVNTLVSYCMYIFFLYVLGAESYQTALALAWFLSSFISFTLQKTIVFQTKGNWVKEYIRCIFSWGIGYLLNAVLLELMVNYLQFNPLVAQFIALCCTTVTTYFLFKYFAFKVRNDRG